MPRRREGEQPDKVPRQAPGAREKKQLLHELESEGEVWGISPRPTGDTSTRLPDRRGGDDRQPACLRQQGGATHHLLGPGYPLELLLYADAGSRKVRIGRPRERIHG